MIRPEPGADLGRIADLSPSRDALITIHVKSENELTRNCILAAANCDRSLDELDE
jgi:hypothetical protein